MNHGILEHKLFKKEPFTEREAWIWLIDKAYYKEETYRHKSDVVTIKRGQVPTSYRKLMQYWGWGSARTQKYINLLKKERMIDTEPDTPFLIITICNYDIYQFDSTKADTQVDTKADTQADTQADTNINKRNNINKENKDNSLESADLIFFKMVDIWNEIVQKKRSDENVELTESRMSLMSQRLKDQLNNNIESWTNYCKRIALSDFLMGRSEKSTFKARIDWALVYDNIKKVREGNYDNIKQKPQNSTTYSSNFDAKEHFNAIAKKVAEGHGLDITERRFYNKYKPQFEGVN